MRRVVAIMGLVLMCVAGVGCYPTWNPPPVGPPDWQPPTVTFTIEPDPITDPRG